MAGSIHNFNYYTDANTKFIVRMDESNGKAIGNEEMNETLSFVGLPKNLTPRYVVYRSNDGRTKRKIVISKKDTNVPATITIKNGVGADEELGQPVVFAEKSKAYYKADSGLNDGTP
jgi:hypothetical protein